MKRQNQSGIRARVAALAALSLALVTFSAAAEDLGSILDKNENMPRPAASVAEMRMVITNKAGQSRTREIQAWTAYAEGEYNKQMMVFTAPADVRDTRFLTIDWKDAAKPDEQAIYIPALRKVRTIGASGGDSKTGAFLGSDFSYADIGTLDRSDFTVTLIGEETLGGVKCWKIQYDATGDKTIEKYGYGRVIRWINEDNYTSRQSEFYDRGGKAVKRLEITGTELVDGKYWQFKAMRMNNLESGGNTLWEFTKSQNLAQADEKYFTLRFLERGR